MADLKDLEQRIKNARKKDTAEEDLEKEYADRNTGMRAGSEFIAYVFSGGVVGWVIGHFFGNLALWLILMVFLGFGLGIYRASQTMK